MSFQDAATLGVGINTISQVLYQSLKLALPSAPTKDATHILIYGGSTARISVCQVVQV
ncbi:Polyketide synthase enoylreductase [Penicillium riverlandense]|uniref:Polyketide synthase enoylreductase n=1 Tax=Penicillium riverlandense TaxID=1903569 RepID=UPI0025476770|nr:Polyketide synthase enoylreductase [Penicillium riverlandense]KAJ5819427.1 Polyketide synthase enoylreductase [Penicillium riverlandense]